MLPKNELTEKAILVGVKLFSNSDNEEEHLQELAELTRTAGASVVHTIIQKREKPDPATFIGKGKVEEIGRLVRGLTADLVIFDEDISPSQQYNLEKNIPCKIIDRTALILDIFAQHAYTSEGKVQVELAQLNYRLSRLRGKGIDLSRLGAGIGTKGPGETKLEVDRRRIFQRIRSLEKRLEEINRSRQVQRKRRKRTEIPVISLVGYTNTGKSTLLNLLTPAEVNVEDMLFATLDSTTRKLYLNRENVVLLSDTVGFIRKLPHQLVAAFRSTLDGIKEADLILHIIDANHPQRELQIEAVERVLKEIGVSDKPIISIFNKIDLIEEEEFKKLRRKYPEGVFISGLKAINIDDLQNTIINFFGGQA